MNNAVGVIGCGWLGLPLAKVFLEDRYVVYGTTTSQEKIGLLKKIGVVPFLIKLREDNIDGAIAAFLANVETLIINVPPQLRGANTENYIKKMQVLHAEVKTSNIKKVVFVSSISVYGDIEGEVTEDTQPQPVTASGKQLLVSEKIFKNDPDLQTAIIRFGGLIGPNRHPVTRLTGRKALRNGHAFVNLIHLDDCMNMIKTIVKKGYWNQVFNGVYPEHPSKRDYYSSEAVKRGLVVPEYLDENRENKGKIVISRNFLNKKQGFFTSLTY